MRPSSFRLSTAKGTMFDHAMNLKLGNKISLLSGFSCDPFG